VGVINSPGLDTTVVQEETSMEIARMGDRMTTLTATNKVATADPTTARTEILRAAMDNRMTPTVATNRAATVDPTKRTKTPRAGTDDQTTPMGVTEVVTVNLTTDRTAASKATVDRTTTAIVNRKVLTEAAPLIAVDRINLTKATGEVMANLTIPTTLVPMANRRNAAVGMAAPEEVIVLNGTTTTTRMTPPVIVRDTNPRISHRRTLTLLATPTPPVIPIPLGEAMVEVVRRKAGTTLAATEEATMLMAAKNEAVMVAVAVVVKVMAEDIIIRSIMMTMTRPMVLRDWTWETTMTIVASANWLLA